MQTFCNHLTKPSLCNTTYTGVKHYDSLLYNSSFNILISFLTMINEITFFKVLYKAKLLILILINIKVQIKDSPLNHILVVSLNLKNKLLKVYEILK
jgi:hypothetical protein